MYDGHIAGSGTMAGYKGRIRIAIVDDSEVYRIFLRKILLSNPDFDVICLASNGRLAIPRIRHYLPDVVILDHDMPEMNGLETIKQIRSFSQNIRIIMFSAHTVKGAELTIEALANGAEDFITKPGLTPGELEKIGEVLPQKIRLLVSHRNEKMAAEERRSATANAASTGYRYCGIGISTGGPTALRRLLPLIPQSIDGSIFIVQHLPPLFTKQLAENLNGVTNLTVVEAEDGMIPRNGYVYLAPGGRQIELKPGETDRIRIFDGVESELCKPSVNILFNSLSENYGKNSIGVIMTGMGEDGLIGMRAMHREGAYLMAQKAEDCLIYGMPARPVKEGLISEQGDVETLAKRITALLGGV